jgi:hypothetical protein
MIGATSVHNAAAAEHNCKASSSFLSQNARMICSLGRKSSERATCGCPHTEISAVAGNKRHVRIMAKIGATSAQDRRSETISHLQQEGWL